MSILHMLTSQAERYITRYVPFHVIPRKPVLEIFTHFCTPWMHKISGVMSFKHYCMLQIFLCWYTQSVFKIENSFYQHEVWSRCNVIPDSYQFRIFKLSLFKHRFKYWHSCKHYSVVHQLNGQIQMTTTSILAKSSISGNYMTQKCNLLQPKVALL